jgi:predicted DNA-binding transcriptional regulator AlpA
MTDDKTAASPRGDLIGMADIAQMAGQSRATVGNWKRRHPDDFPKQRGSSPRGPLYDAAEVVTWLASQSRPSAEDNDVATAALEMADAIRADVPMREQLPLILALLSAGRDIGPRSRTSYLDLVDALAHVLDLANEDVRALSALNVADRHVERLVVIANRIESPPTLDDITGLLDRFRLGFGVHDTPLGIAKLMAALAGPGQSIYNPCLGFGTLLAACSLEGGTSQGQVLAGQEASPVVALCARLVFRMLGIPVDLIVADSLARDVRPGTTYERVVADLPMGQRLLPETLRQEDPRWTFEDPGATGASPAWIQECLHHLAPSGRAVLLVTPSALFAQARAGRLRQRLIRADLLDAVLALPPGLLMHTSIALALLIFRRDRPRHGSGTPGPVLIGEIPSAGGGRARALDEASASAFAAGYLAWSDGAEDVPAFSRAVTYSELAENEFMLQPRRHVPTATDDAMPGLQELGERLATALKAAQSAEAFIADYLKGTR